MAVKFLSTKRIKILKILVIASGIFIVAMIIYFPSYAKLRELRSQNQRLRFENKGLEAEIADYQEKISRIGKDPYIFEKFARDNLGVAKDNEIVIDISE